MIRNWTIARLAATAIAGCLLAPPASAQDDTVTPIATPAQADAVVLGTGPLPGATAAESWHRQYGSAFARNVTIATLTPYLADPAKASGAAVIVAPGGGFRTMTPEEMREMFGDGDPFSDFFHTFFGGDAGAAAGRRGRSARGPSVRPGRDLEHEIELGLEDAYRGATRRLSVKHDGHARTVDVRIPPGVGDGSRVRVSGEGEAGTAGAQAGDLYLRIRLTPHPTFERKGRDLYTRLPVPLTTLVLGGEADVPTLDGKSLRLKIPPTTPNGQLFRLKGHGMPTAGRADEHGDLYATVEVQLPGELTPEQRLHFEALRDLERKKKTHSAA
jgi:DnaJ-class molecular chaperone